MPFKWQTYFLHSTESKHVVKPTWMRYQVQVACRVFFWLSTINMAVNLNRWYSCVEWVLLTTLIRLLFSWTQTLFNLQINYTPYLHFQEIFMIPEFSTWLKLLLIPRKIDKVCKTPMPFPFFHFFKLIDQILQPMEWRLFSGQILTKFLRWMVPSKKQVNICCIFMDFRSNSNKLS